jgi:hypothetical protein
VKHLNAALRDADPLSREPGLSDADAAAIRRAVVAAADRADSSAAAWPRPLFVAATIAATVVAGVGIGSLVPRRAAQPEPRRAASAQARAQADARRQLQFATPGGTRIIWVFDPEFNP